MSRQGRAGHVEKGLVIPLAQFGKEGPWVYPGESCKQGNPAASALTCSAVRNVSLGAHIAAKLRQSVKLRPAGEIEGIDPPAVFYQQLGRRAAEPAGAAGYDRGLHRKQRPPFAARHSGGLPPFLQR